MKVIGCRVGPYKKFYVIHNNWVALGKEDASRFGEASLFLMVGEVQALSLIHI